MANGPNQGQRRRPRKRSRKRRPKSNKNILKLSVAAVTLVIIVIFLIALGLDPTIGAVICMLALGVIFYLMATGQSKPRRRKRKPRQKEEKKVDEPQFYTALPSSLGLTDIPEEPPTPQVKLPPRPIRAARRRRDFITYPVTVGVGDYSDSYVQVDKDTVLRLRSEMTPESSPNMLPGQRIDTFPSSKIGAVMSQEVKPSVESVEPQVETLQVSEATPIIAEAVPVVADVAEASPVVEPVDSTSDTPVVQPAVVQEEEEEEVEFDMEWD